MAIVGGRISNSKEFHSNDTGITDKELSEIFKKFKTISLNFSRITNETLITLPTTVTTLSILGVQCSGALRALPNLISLYVTVKRDDDVKIINQLNLTLLFIDNNHSNIPLSSLSSLTKLTDFSIYGLNYDNCMIELEHFVKFVPNLISLQIHTMKSSGLCYINSDVLAHAIFYCKKLLCIRITTLMLHVTDVSNLNLLEKKLTNFAIDESTGAPLPDYLKMRSKHYENLTYGNINNDYPLYPGLGTALRIHYIHWFSHQNK